VDATTPETYLADLNSAQRESVLHTEGSALVIAGAGAGKSARAHALLLVSGTLRGEAAATTLDT
jgi:hypothetical protein